jgi:hypothetical protein
VNRGNLGAAVGLLSVAGAELAYLGLSIYLVVVTFQSTHLQQPNVGGAVVGATGALAGIFGAAYAALLGIPPAGGTEGLRDLSAAGAVWRWIKSALSMNNVLAAGVILYLLASAALGATYLFREVESPGIVKTIAVAFGGYIVAYVGKAYADWAAAS